MNCPKCNSEVRPGAKFCTKCGQKIVSSPMCPQCGASLKLGAKFCTKCGFRLEMSEAGGKSVAEKASMQSHATDMKVAKGRIYWNVQPGQVARVIDEAEFESYNKIQGVIVPEGTTAYIRANGRTIASISGGAYDFMDPENVYHPIVKKIRKGWKMLLGLFNRKKETGIAPTEEEVYMHQQKVILENAEKGAVFSVVVLLDKAFPLMIGAKHENLDDYSKFEPMVIQTRYLQMGIGVNAYFRIVDPERFIRHYLTDCQLLSSASLVHEMTDTIRVALQDALYDTELSSNRIPTELHSMLKDRINAVAAESFFGVSIVRIVEISAENEALKRFAKLSQEIYIEEKELDYLRRTNDFKNRLADEINAQNIHEAKTDLDLTRQLNEINRNRQNEELLSEDELTKFRHLLFNERIVREAQSDNERDAALAEMEKTGLVRWEELDVLKHQVLTGNYQRNTALSMMQLRDGIEFERVRLEGEAEKASMIVKKELELQGLRDEYGDSRFYKELDKQRHVAETTLDLEQRQRDMDYNDVKRLHDLKREDDDAQFQQFMAMHDAEERSKDSERRHEAEMEQNRLKSAEEMERLKWENAQNLSDEKVWALSGGEGAVAYAQNKYNAGRERETAERLEAQRREQDARLDAERAARDADQRDTKERMFDMMNNMMAMAGGIQAQRAEDRDRRTQERLEEKERQLRERDERILRQEGRMDTAYDRALDYTTREKVVPQPPQYEVHVQPVSKQSVAMKCPECGAVLETGAAFCEDCGAKINK